MRINEFAESHQRCPKCGGPSFSNLVLAEKQDACYAKVKSRYKVWPSAYASGALVQCRKKGAANWGNKSEGVAEGWVKGEYGRVLDALQLYYPRIGMTELNVPGYHKVIANKANVPVEYAAQVINDFVRANDPDEEWPEDDDQGVAEGSMYGDEEVSWEKGGRRAPTGAFRNPAAEKINQANKILDNPNSSPDMKKAAASILGQEQMLLRQYKDTAARRKQGMAEGIFGSKESPALPVVNKIASVASRLNPQNVDTGRQIIQAHASELARMLSPQAKSGVDVIEDYNAEYDDEAGMADNNLETLERAVEGIDELINAGDNLPEWCQEKIAVAKSMLVTVWDYMKSEEDRGATAELAEEFDMIERIIESIAAQNGVDSEAVWTDLESLTEDELYAFAVTSQLNEDWSKVNKRDKTDGMSQKAVNAYRRENPGSKLKTAVTTKPSKLKKGSKASKRRKSYCSRSRGQMKMHNISCAKTPDKAICKARRRWNC